ncbi:HD domain-containing protein [Aquihabitans daechungensis]|uniref:HD domain-containing protein n=1 Tax=Aquihabitans daechungensis TaxID=1052257 RepID=UPI003B9DD133
MPAGDVDEVLALFEQWGTETYDEDVSQLDHALQTAALARAARAGDALVAASLLHDVGHLLELRDGGIADGRTEADLGHEGRGARWLAPVFPAPVTGPIALHVAAKRYRCAVDPGYHDGLSDGSRRSLVRQGGPMSPLEVERFAAHPAHADAVALRGWDDGGKVEDLAVADLASYRDLLHRLAR